jgi:hypothetical protein
MLLLDVLEAIRNHQALRQLTVAQLFSFISYASLLKQDIQLPQPSTLGATPGAPRVLPLSISEFLADSTEIPLEYISDCWVVLKDVVWGFPETRERERKLLESFRLFGWKRGLSKWSPLTFVHFRSCQLTAAIALYPPYESCTNLDCSQRPILKKEEAREALVFTLAHGVQPAWSVHLRCQCIYQYLCILP